MSHITLGALKNSKEVLIMATSSIFANVKITDSKHAEAFANALEASANDSRKTPTAPIIPTLTDLNAIRAMMAKRITV